MNFRKKISFLFRIIKPQRIKRAIFIFKSEGWQGIKYHYFLIKDKEKGSKELDGRRFEIMPLKEYDCKDKYPMFQFNSNKEPLVSIVIPVYNQFAYTYNCLWSIHTHNSNIAIELIVADDNSSDMTVELEEIINGIKVIHNKKNKQFLVNCNNAAKEAKGKYIVFLNNDTQVQKDWLKALTDLMEEDINIGLAGSKLVYPNGRVQEAGGIVWKDGTVLQYGNDRQSGEEELNYLRETDYISGASIIIRKTLWDEIGGFDERYAPAYYEDVDLAFEVRKRGYRVVYQPESEVIHFEGMTEGKDIGKKTMIEINRMKFWEKWDETLKNSHFAAVEYPKMLEKMKKDRIG